MLRQRMEFRIFATLVLIVQVSCYNIICTCDYYYFNVFISYFKSCLSGYYLDVCTLFLYSIADVTTTFDKVCDNRPKAGEKPENEKQLEDHDARFVLFVMEENFHVLVEKKWVE